ncbi:hypothetical protein [Streptomyces sp. NPDC001809]
MKDADEGAGVVEGAVGVGGGRMVGGVYRQVFLWMTVGRRGGRLTDGRFPGTRCDLR